MSISLERFFATLCFNQNDNFLDNKGKELEVALTLPIPLPFPRPQLVVIPQCGISLVK